MPRHFGEIGLPNPNGILTDEKMTLDVLKSLGLNLTTVNIEACHVVPSKRKGGKRVTVCRFYLEKRRKVFLRPKRENVTLIIQVIIFS